MFFDASNELDRKRAEERFEWIIENQKRFEMKVKNPRRSIPQNSYLHLILTWFGVEFGYTLEEVKQDIFKKEVNVDIFYQGQVGQLIEIPRWKSTADIDTKEMTLAIDRFRDFSSQNGCYLPQPGEMDLINEMERQLQNQNIKQYT
jgi:hypothetical protein